MIETDDVRAPRRSPRQPPVVTPDGRYIVVRGRLWRHADPRLESGVRKRLVRDLMASRRAVRTALADADVEALAAARRQVDAAKVALGERGPVWWDDGAPDLNRHMARNTIYADWFAALEPAAAGPAKPDVRTPDAGS
jgi:hypothetical protein